MGKFDGVFLLSDWDGTVYFDKKLSNENIEAIKYFEANGGKFTICSGRYYKFLQEFVPILGIDTYLICYNGAYIINPITKEVLYEGYCDEHLFQILDEIVERQMPYTAINIYDSDNEAPVSYTLDEYISAKERSHTNRSSVKP